MTPFLLQHQNQEHKSYLIGSLSIISYFLTSSREEEEQEQEHQWWKFFEQGGQSFDGQEESKETEQGKTKRQRPKQINGEERQEEKIKVCAVFLSVWFLIDLLLLSSTNII